MKILCLQLARLGDILLSAPALHALKRSNPSMQLDILVRPRFEGAAQIFSDWLNVKTLGTENILGPLLNDDDVQGSLKEFSSVVGSLRDENYDLVLNLTFSPLSSYLTKLIGVESTRGYTRFSDGSFALKDFISGYFYSQVGIGRPNRLHLSDIFASMAGVDLTDADWNLIKKSEDPEGVVVHVGASQQTKALTVDNLVMIISALHERGIKKITLVGSSDEAPIANQIVNRVDKKVENLCGRTTIQELIKVIASTELVIGADSAPMHFATLTGVPCLNLSFPTVNFFETGPRSTGSRILFAESPDQVMSHIVANEASRMLEGKTPAICIAESFGPTEHFYSPRWKRLDNEWSIIKSAYFRVPFDGQLSPLEISGINNLKELNELIVNQYLSLEGGQNNLAHDFIQQAEALFGVVAKTVPSLQVIVRWLEASRTTVGPGATHAIVQFYKNIHVDLAVILDELVPPEEKTHGNEKLPAD
jgi:heptosyltransferase III